MINYYTYVIPPPLKKKKTHQKRNQNKQKIKLIGMNDFHMIYFCCCFFFNGGWGWVIRLFVCWLYTYNVRDF